MAGDRLSETTGTNRRRGAPASSEGFTVVEMVVVVAIFAILVTVALPGFVSIARGQRVKAASFELFATVTFARSEAVTRNRAVVVSPVGGDWASGWTVLDGAVVLRQQPAFQGIVISGPASVTYMGTGRLQSVVSSFDVSTGDGTGHGRCVTIDLSGRPVSKSEAC